MIRTPYCLWSLVLALALTGCPKKQPAEPAKTGEQPAEPRKQEPRKRELKIGIAIPSYVHAVAWLAQEKGHFAARGIEGEVITMNGSPSTMKGIIAGEIKVGLAGGNPAIKANLSGADLVVFGSVVSKHYHRLVVKKEIRTPKDLKGKVIGIQTLGGPQDYLVYVLCRKWGLKYGEDVKLRVTGKEYARITAVSKGLVDGVASTVTRDRVAKLGLNVLADPRGWEEPAPYIVMVAKRSYLKNNRALVLDFMRALAEAQAQYLSKRDEALKVIAPKLGKRGDAQQNYVEGGPMMYDLPATPSKDALKLALDYLATTKEFADKAKSYKISQMIDGSLVQELVAEGVYNKAVEAKKALARTLTPATPSTGKEQTPAKK